MVFVCLSNNSHDWIVQIVIFVHIIYFLLKVYTNNNINYL
jgi:hypothetical protein